MTSEVSPSLLDVTLADRYERTDGVVLLSGVQAIVRLIVDQRRADLARGLNTGGFVTGYPGSPLAGLDLELTRRQELLDRFDVVHRPGLNEELAATAVAGSQLAALQPDHTKDGVFALWYAKSPGLDRASDALRHGNLMGTDRNGGVLVCVGDDPMAKSSSVPSTSEPTLYALAMPILSPADPQEIIDLGLHGFALSRASGLWVGLRLPASVADATQSVTLDSERHHVVTPSTEFDGVGFVHEVSAQLLGTKLIELERSLYGPRLEIARRYSRANALNQVTAHAPSDRLGVIATGPAYLEVRHALERVGVTDCARAGVRLLKVSMPYPLDEQLVRDFAEGLDEIVVVEDKRAFLETLVKSALYGVRDAPRVLGKLDQHGQPLVPVAGQVDADTLAPILAARVLAIHEVSEVRDWLERPREEPPTSPPLVRGAYFCSGCPHNTSVRVPPGSYVGSGSGCHGLAIQMDPRQVGQVVGRFQMGGEGAMWNGMSPFVASEHFVQNMGDGTLAHSGSLAVRAAVAAKVNITYKLLVNSTVAMTGGQPIQGGRTVADLCALLLAEGVAKIIVTTKDPSVERAKGLPSQVEIWPSERLVEAQEILARVKGVSVLLHDQECAVELRRQRKRGVRAQPLERVHVNTRICEDCGDCGAQSNCLSVRPVETRWGSKTQIHQESCNFEYSCLLGDCPALTTVRPPKKSPRRSRVELDDDDLVAPTLRVPRDLFTMRVSGIGGTGVLSAAQIVAMAAQLEGRFVRELDQTGIAQKGGAVVSDLRISQAARDDSARLGEGECDLYLGGDLLVAATAQYLVGASSRRTVAVVSTSPTPTGRQVADREIHSPSIDSLRQLVDARSRPEHNVWLDAQQLTRDTLGEDTAFNITLLGVAFQNGALPLEARALERAIELNGVAVDANLRAFRAGRRYVIERHGPQAKPTHEFRASDLDPALAGVVESIGAIPRGRFESLVAERAADLKDYQDLNYARRYASVLKCARDAEERLGIVDGPFATAVAIELHRLMAHKDEYEVARLHLESDAREEIARVFGPHSRVTYHLAPPVLQSWGRKRKVRVRVGARASFWLLYRLRRLRHTRFDPFAWTSSRRLERDLRDEYVTSTQRLSASLSSDNHARAVELANLPQLIRGFGDVRARNVARYQQRRAALADDTDARFLLNRR